MPPGYDYYTTSAKNTGLEQKGILDAQQLSHSRLNPTLDDVDYLVLRHRTRILGEWFANINCNPLSVLDVGGRIQPYRPLLEPLIERYVAVDVQLQGLVDVLAEGDCLPFGEHTFDIALCTQALHYMPDPGLAITEMHRVLRPGGSLFLTTPSLFPEHHDHFWRFLPGGLRYLTRDFATVEIRAEGYSGAGLLRAINVTLHADVKNPRVLRLARRTTIPILNLLGLLLDWLVAPNTRSTANYSVMAVKKASCRQRT